MDAPSRWVKKLWDTSCETEIADILAAITDHYGLSVYAVLNVPSETSTELASNILLTNWPEDMLRRYDQAGMIHSSPVMGKLRHSTNPFTYDLRSSGKGTDPRGSLALDLFGRYGLWRSAFFPAHTSSGQRGALAFGGERELLSPREMTELNAIANLTFGKVLDFRSDQRRAVSLSQREIECLSWASAGKTSIEMSEILGLSEYTVNHYLNRATRKLDAVNRVQAVAKAVRAGLLT
ncbi:MAG: autoinducer binding domain-containing protein [Shinella sp.]|nr:autoinducer binding domain-containing protein [Shinella sp.]